MDSPKEIMLRAALKVRLSNIADTEVRVSKIGDSQEAKVLRRVVALARNELALLDVQLKRRLQGGPKSD